MKKDWRELHGIVIKDFLQFVNQETSSFILKGGTALAQCYHLDRFSEDIDFDAKKENIVHHIQNFCKNHKYDFRIAKDTATVKRGFINYGNNEKPLKIEVSYRNQRVSENDITKINGIMVYSIDKLAQMKSNAYNARDKIRDLFDLAFITNNYYEQLSMPTINIISDALQYKGLEQVDYVLATQQDELIDAEKLISSFLEMHERLDLLYNDDEKEIIKNYKSISENIKLGDLAEAINFQGGKVSAIDMIKQTGQKCLSNRLDIVNERKQ